MENLELQYRTQTNLVVALAGLLFLFPFAVNNFVQARSTLGVGSMMIVMLLAYNAWDIRFRQQVPWTTTFLLAPLIIVFVKMSFQRQGVVGALWCYPAVLSFYFMLEERQARIMNLLLIGVAIPAAWSAVESPLAVRVTATLLAVSIFSALSIRVINAQQQKLSNLAITDSLTGLYNRTLLEPTLSRVAEQSARSGSPTSLLAMDLDHFKSVNDTFGHDAGDCVLRAFSQVLGERLRRSDVVFRTGGEEFLVILHHTDWNGAVQVGEELRAITAASCLIPNKRVTMSGGLATMRPGESWPDWLKRADKNLYAAKRTGRNRIVSDESKEGLVESA
jgi:diguanylate cyclase (GGDEF)-like protein